MDSIALEQALIAYMFHRKSGGRGLMQVEEAFIAETLNLVEYVESKGDPLIQIIRVHQHDTTMQRIRRT
jgi:hypothetical protein